MRTYAHARSRTHQVRMMEQYWFPRLKRDIRGLGGDGSDPGGHETGSFERGGHANSAELRFQVGVGRLKFIPLICDFSDKLF